MRSLRPPPSSSPVYLPLSTLRKLNVLMKTLQTPHWTLNYPDNWEVETEDEVNSLFDPKGEGELVISTQSFDEALTMEDLRGIAAEDLEAGAQPDEITAGAFQGMHFDYESEGEYWVEWYLAHKNQLIFATYNCDAESDAKEIAIVEVILSTLKVA